MDNPRVYFASLADYNAGRLHGVWVDIDTDTTVDDLHQAIADMLQTSREDYAEEWAIHDYEGFGSYRLSEYESLDDVATIGALIAKHGEAFAAYVDYEGGMQYVDAEQFEDAYNGEWSSEEDFAESLAEDLGFIDRDARWPNSHIDWEAAARDLFYGGDYYSIDAPSGIYVFRSI